MKRDISKKELIKKISELEKDLDRRPNKRDNSSLYYYARKYFGSWNNLMKSAGFKTKFRQTICSIKFNKDFAYFIGLLVTDGHIVYDNIHGKYKVMIYTSYPKERDMIINLIKRLFNYKPSVTSRMYGFSKKPNFEIKITSKFLVNILVNDFGVMNGAKSFKVTVPKIIKNSKNPIIKKAFLRGVIDGDGSILRREIKIASSSINFLKDLKDIFNYFHVPSGEIFRNSKVTNVLEFRTYGAKNMEKLYRLLYPADYYYKRKKNKWENNIFK
ncbi:MAG: LAGLIDADG family homing endonuclease [Nanoarchaeota archaeon]